MNAMIGSATFWRALAERVISTGLPAAILSITLASLDQIRWGQVEMIVCAAALLALAKGIITGTATGISGTGVVAEGVVFGDGSCVMHWLGDVASTVVYNSIDDVIAIHGHGGKRRTVYGRPQRVTDTAR